MERLFGLDGQTLFDAAILAVNMFVLFTVGSYLFFNPVRSILEKRQNRIKEEREQAIADKNQAAESKAQYEEKLASVEKEAEAILSDARKRAMKNEDRIVEEAKEEAARIIAHAKQEAELEKKKSADEVKQEIIKVATLMAGKVVAVSMDQKKMDELVEETLKEIGEDTWLS